MKFFGESAKTLGKEAKELAKVNRKRNDHLTSLDRIFDEWEGRELQRTKLQVEVSHSSEKIGLPGKELGIFGVPFEGRQQTDPGVRDIHVFTSEPHTDFEDLHFQQIDKQSELLKQQTLYESVTSEAKHLNDSIDKICEMREILEKDLVQINQELLVIEIDQLGPPRRLSVPGEMVSIDVWKNRSFLIKKKIDELQYSLDKADNKKRTADLQALDIAKKIAVLQEQLSLEKREGSVSAIDGNLGMLPIVVGKSIGKVSGMGGIASKPKELYDAITHQSRLVDIKAMSQQAGKIHQERTSLEQQLWIQRQDERENSIDMERVLSRLSTIADRLKNANTEILQKSIVDSLKAFFASSFKLKPTTSRLTGILPWFKHHDHLLSKNVVRYITSNAMGALSFDEESTDDLSEENKFSYGVTLGEEREGYCAGVIQLPKDGLWTILVTVTRQGSGEAYENLDTSDFISVKIGPSFGSMSNIGMFFNRVNPSTGTVLYDVKHVYRGNAFAFRFDFSSSKYDTKKHLAVCTGLYEEYEMKDLEFVTDPKSIVRQRVLSSYVKMIRIDEKAGKLKETKLLEELIDIERSSSDVWDSEIINNYRQRYSREYFLRILRAEILLQKDISMAEMKRKMQEIQAEKALLAGADLEVEARIEKSMKKYLMKKRLTQKHILDEGNDLVDKRLMIWDVNKNVWRLVLVVECIVKWVDNGLLAVVTHRVQEYNEGNEKIGKEMEIDLKKFKYFMSPVQDVDLDAIARWKEKKNWDENIRVITENAKEKVFRLHQSFEVYKKREIKSLEVKREKAFDKLDDNVYKDAKKAVKGRAARRSLKLLVEEVLIDARKGLVMLKEKSKEKKREEAEVVAEERFIANFIKDKKQALIEIYDAKKEDLENDLVQKMEEVKNLQYRIVMKADHGKYMCMYMDICVSISAYIRDTFE